MKRVSRLWVAVVCQCLLGACVQAIDITVDARENVVVLDGKPAVKATLDLTKPVSVCSSGLAWQDLNRKPYAGVILVVRNNCQVYIIPNESCVTIEAIGRSSEVYLFFTDHGGTWDNGGSVRVSFAQDGANAFEVVVSGKDNVIELTREPVVSVDLNLAKAWGARAFGEAYYDLAQGRYVNLLLVVDNDQRAYALPIGGEVLTHVIPLGFRSQVHAFFVDALPPSDNRGEVSVSLEEEFLLNVPAKTDLTCGAQVSVLMTNPEEIRAISFGLSHDHHFMALEDIVEGEATADADIFIKNVDPAPCPDDKRGGTLAVVVSEAPPLRTVPTGTFQEVARFLYEREREGRSIIEFVDCLGEPPVEVVLDVRGVAVDPATVGGFVQVHGTEFWRGDANEDGSLNIADPVKVLYHLFGGEDLSCLDAADGNDDGRLDIADPIYLINYLFRGGPNPPPPFPDCGWDPTEDGLDCWSFPPCCG